MISTTGCQAQWFEPSLVGQKAPDFKLRTLSGSEKSLAQATDGKDAILFFWASWCPHCREQVGELAGRMDEFKANDVQVVFINIGESPSQIKGFLKRMNVETDVLMDETGSASGEYQVAGIPTLVFVGKDGVIRASGHGLPEDYSQAFGK